MTPSQPVTLPRVPRLLTRDLVFRASLALCFLIAFLVRWIFLGTESLWFDEGWTWWLVTQPASKMYGFIRVDTCAPLYFYLLHFWTLAFGDSERGLRSMSALLATLALVPWYLLARRMFESKLALLAAAILVAIACMQVQFAREARPYALVTLSIMVALSCVPTLAKKRSWPAMLTFAIGISAGMYSHNTAGFYAPCLASAWLIWTGERSLRARLIDLSIVVAICIGLFLPWVPTLLEQAKWVSGNFWATRPDFFSVSQTTSIISGVDIYSVTPFFWHEFGRSPTAEGLAAFVFGWVVLCTLLAICTKDRALRRRALAIAVAAFGPIMLIFIQSSIGKPVFISRVFLPASVIVPLLIASLAEAQRPGLLRRFGIVTVAFLVALGLISTIGVLVIPQKDNWRGAYSYVKKLPPSSSRAIVFVAAEGELPFNYYRSRDPKHATYYHTGAPQGFFELDPPRTMQRVQSDADLLKLDKTLSAGDYDEVVLVLAHEDHVDKQGRALAWLESHWRKVDERVLPNIQLVRYVPK